MLAYPNCICDFFPLFSFTLLPFAHFTAQTTLLPTCTYQPTPTPTYLPTQVPRYAPFDFPHPLFGISVYRAPFASINSHRPVPCP
ncbi:hypothetical protein LZ32DRAFT_160525 [Colletotrichum eremochloae]|nr:hypothetical protein LZ32DRAFT_160525 [Colletotrichum eremochloae]